MIHAATVLGVAEQYDCWSVLAYGCGGGLADALKDSRLAVCEYDPDVKGGRPSFADLVVVDQCDSEVLAGARRLARKAVLCVAVVFP